MQCTFTRYFLFPQLQKFILQDTNWSLTGSVYKFILSFFHFMYYQQNRDNKSYDDISQLNYYFFNIFPFWYTSNTHFLSSQLTEDIAYNFVNMRFLKYTHVY